MIKFYCPKFDLGIALNRDWKVGVAVGAGNCETSPASMLATLKEPKWWKYPTPNATLIEGPIYRSFSAYWKCCCSFDFAGEYAPPMNPR
jgi:hypothetical protein